MRKLLYSLSLVLVLCLPITAGEVNMPPAPPPCSENCTSSVTTTTSTVLLTLIQTVLGVIRG